jgi:nitrite reductase/ring-hydroxylating ferredoxin subunit
MSAATPQVALDVCSVDELSSTGKLVVKVDDTELFLVWHDGQPVALENTCIHRGRRISEGFLFNGRAVCPGHQWSFDLTTGFCKERDRTQPAWQTAVEDGRVLVSARSARD